MIEPIKLIKPKNVPIPRRACYPLNAHSRAHVSRFADFNWDTSSYLPNEEYKVRIKQMNLNLTKLNDSREESPKIWLKIKVKSSYEIGKAFLGTFFHLRPKPLINRDTKFDSVGLVVAQFNFQKKLSAERADKTKWSEAEFWKQNNKNSQTKMKSQCLSLREDS